MSFLKNLWKKKNESSSPFRQSALGRDKHTASLWHGVIGKTVLREIALRTRFFYVQEESGTPFITHDFYCWCRTSDRAVLVFAVKMDLGSWKLLPFQDSKYRWNHPDEFREAKTQLSDCAKQITHRLLEEFLILPSEMFDGTEGEFWLGRIQDFAIDCPLWKKPIGKDEFLFSDGKSAWIDRIGDGKRID